MAVATCDLPMNPCGHCVHVTKSASIRTRCGLLRRPDAAVADGGSKLSTTAAAAAVAVVEADVSVAMVEKRRRGVVLMMMASEALKGSIRIGGFDC